MSKFKIAKEGLNRLVEGIEMIPASKLISKLKSPDVKVGEDLPTMWSRTSMENKNDFKNSIATEGVLKPITVNGDWLVDGHHRLIAAFEANPNMLVPVKQVGFNASKYKVKPKTRREKLYAEYLSSSRGPENPQELIDKYGYKQLVASADENDTNWLDFADVWGSIL
jgi:hypothetical protein